MRDLLIFVLFECNNRILDNDLDTIRSFNKKNLQGEKLKSIIKIGVFEEEHD
jgi:hypothetical protein